MTKQNQSPYFKFISFIKQKFFSTVSYIKTYLPLPSVKKPSSASHTVEPVDVRNNQQSRALIMKAEQFCVATDLLLKSQFNFSVTSLEAIKKHLLALEESLPKDDIAATVLVISDMQHIMNRIAFLDMTAFANVETKLRELQTVLNAKTLQVEALKLDNEIAQAQITDLTVVKRTLENRLDDMLQDLTATRKASEGSISKQDYSNLKTELQHEQQGHENALNLYKNHKNEVDDLKGQIKEMEENVTLRNVDTEKLRNDMKELERVSQQKFDALTAKHERLVTEYKEINMNFNALSAKHNEVTVPITSPRLDIPKPTSVLQGQDHNTGITKLRQLTLANLKHNQNDFVIFMQKAKKQVELQDTLITLYHNRHEVILRLEILQPRINEADVLYKFELANVKKSNQPMGRNHYKTWANLKVENDNLNNALKKFNSDIENIARELAQALKENSLDQLGVQYEAAISSRLNDFIAKSDTTLSTQPEQGYPTPDTKSSSRPVTVGTVRPSMNLNHRTGIGLQSAVNPRLLLGSNPFYGQTFTRQNSSASSAENSSASSSPAISPRALTSQDIVNENI